ncbi:MAG: carboxypeptidase-like regulatory domain-containing protein, partial [Bacteroidota bacterium]
VRGTKIATKTQPDGTFSLSVPPTAKTLIISIVGYKEVEMSVNGNLQNIAMQIEESTLTEVVVTGYKQQSKRNFAGSASVVKGETIR